MSNQEEDHKPIVFRNNEERDRWRMMFDAYDGGDSNGAAIVADEGILEERTRTPGVGAPITVGGNTTLSYTTDDITSDKIARETLARVAAQLESKGELMVAPELRVAIGNLLRNTWKVPA